MDPEQWTIEQRQESEAEIVRLGEEIAASERRQEALQRYLDLLEDVAARAPRPGRPSPSWRPRGPWPSPRRARAARSG